MRKPGKTLFKVEPADSLDPYFFVNQTVLTNLIKLWRNGEIYQITVIKDGTK